MVEIGRLIEKAQSVSKMAMRPPSLGSAPRGRPGIGSDPRTDFNTTDLRTNHV
jgi:hypothetical protein